MHEIHIHSSFSVLLYSWNFHPCSKNGFSCCWSWLLQNTKDDLGYKSDAEKVAGDFCTALVVKSSFDQSFTADLI